MSMDSRNTAALITSGTNVMLHIWKEFFSRKKPALPAKVAEIRKNPQLAREEIDFMRRRDSRENEFLEIQKYRFEADMKIAAAQADREERALKLRHQEIEDNRKLGRLYLEAVRDQTVKEMDMRRKELQALYDQGKWHCVFSRHEIEQIFGDEKEKHRLLMLISEPDIIEMLPQSFRESLKKELRNKLKSFVEEYYPIDSDLCPVEFYGKYFDRAVFDAEIKQLESVMPVHTAIIYSDITDHEVYFNVRLSGLEKPLSFSTKPWDWEQAKHQLEKDGCGEIQSERQIREIIVRFHQVLAAFLADWYFLNINPHYEPRLFAFQSELPDVLPQEWIGGCVEELRKAKEAYLAELRRQVEKNAEENARRQAEEERKRKEAAEAERRKKEEENSIGTEFGFEVVSVNENGYIFSRKTCTARQKIEDSGYGVKLEMVHIPGGTFMMGSPTSEADRSSDETQHRVTLSPFYMGKYPVTQAQWQAVMGSNPSNFKGANRPVEQVSWDDAIEFCKKLSQKTGKKYRLPTEAEWEYACRAGTTTPFYFGETITPDLVNYNGNYPYGQAPKDRYRQETTEVGSFLPNAFGLYDMHGNIWEWVADIYSNEGVYIGEQTDPIYTGSGSRRVNRGGSWISSAQNCRSAGRDFFSPDNRNVFLGFRLAGK